MADPLDTWNDLNAFIRAASEIEAKRLLADELAGKKRLTFLLRIHSRLNKVRADRERADLKKASA